MRVRIAGGFLRGSAVAKVRVCIADDIFYGFGSSDSAFTHSGCIFWGSDLAIVSVRIADGCCYGFGPIESACMHRG